MVSKSIFTSVVAAAAFTLVAATAAQALPAAGNYDASTGTKDPAYYGGSGSHAIWLPGAIATLVGGNEWIFVPQDGVLTVTNGASATMNLSGTIASVADPNSFFLVSMDFQHYSEFPATAFVGGTPMAKKELFSSAYVENGGPVDSSTWDYYVLLDTSFLQGIAGAVLGLDIDLTQRPNSGALYGPALTQIGVGANGKNIEFGLSTWFNYAGDLSGHGDVNINLEGGGDGTSIPEPTAIALFGLGLVGFGLAARRRNRV